MIVTSSATMLVSFHSPSPMLYVRRLIGSAPSNTCFPLTVKTEGGKQVFDGALPIKRLTYNIGEGEWKDTSMVADDVTIKFHVVAGQ